MLKKSNFSRNSPGKTFLTHPRSTLSHESLGPTAGTPPSLFSLPADPIPPSDGPRGPISPSLSPGSPAPAHGPFFFFFLYHATPACVAARATPWASATPAHEPHLPPSFSAKPHARYTWAFNASRPSTDCTASACFFSPSSL